jgi:RNAse (barnase) inhibitor barstar
MQPPFVAELDGAAMRTLRAFYPRVAKALAFPAYFGRNLDALYDALTSLDTLGHGEVRLIIRRADRLFELEKPERRQAALDVLRDAQVPENRYDGVRFRVYFV